MVLHAVFRARGAHIRILHTFSLLALATFIGMMTSVTSCFISTYVVRVSYFSQKLAIETAAGTTCGECGTDTTSEWINCKDTGTKLCTACYDKNRLDVAAAAGTTCVKCGTDTTNQWYSCKDEPGTKICKPCYDKNRSEKKKAASANEK